MEKRECQERIRCPVSDRLGEMRIENFDIVDAPECEEIADRLRTYLVGQPLADVDLAYIREIGRATHPLCAEVVSKLVQRGQEKFLPAERVGRR